MGYYDTRSVMLKPKNNAVFSCCRELVRLLEFVIDIKAQSLYVCHPSWDVVCLVEQNYCMHSGVLLAEDQQRNGVAVAAPHTRKSRRPNPKLLNRLEELIKQIPRFRIEYLPTRA